jgi:N-methylhydantoinase A
MASYHIAVDIGGTFTDVVIQNTEDGTLWTAKTPSTPSDLASGFMSGVLNAIQQANADPSSVQRIFHGTTIATNAVIERTPSQIGLLTTKGFKYVLEIGRHDIPRRQNIYAWVKPERPVPPNRIFEVSERLDRTGNALVPLSEDDCREAARQLRDSGVEAVAVCFLYSYANPAHEERAAEILREELPGVPIALSSEVLPQFREFERTVATVLNAYVMPRVGRYLSGLESAAKRHGLDAPLFIMKSNGGVTSADMAARQAIHTVLSGPVAGVMGATQIADAAKSPSFISVDVGGTSADICLVRDGEPEMTVERSVGGLPLQLPMLDIVTIGAGGGSIARPLAAGGLSVGPESAGADPGPVCYNQGGTMPTVTDARLVLGHLPPHLLGGEMSLDIEAARRAIQDEIATPLGLELAEAASGIVEIADNNMAGAMRAVSIGRGLDPKDFALLAFGGAGPLHACALASLLGMQSVIVPPTPGVLSTYGLLFTDLRNDYVQTFVHSGEAPSIEEVTSVYSRLEDNAWEWLTSEKVSRDVGQVTRSADLRYEHQGWEITVDMPDGTITEATMEHLIANFHDLHHRLYTYNLPEANVELVNLRISASGALPRHDMSTLPSANGKQPEPESHRPVLFSRSVGYVDTPIYRRDTLLAGSELTGPAIVEQRDTTTLLAPGFEAVVDSYGNLVITGGE